MIDLARQYFDLKLALIQSSGIPDTMLHIHAGLIVFAGVAVATRRGFGSLLPLLAVVVAAAVNEIVDRIAHGSWRPDNTLHDLGYTLLWPLILWLVARFGRSGR